MDFWAMPEIAPKNAVYIWNRTKQMQSKSSSLFMAFDIIDPPQLNTCGIRQHTVPLNPAHYSVLHVLGEFSLSTFVF